MSDVTAGTHECPGTGCTRRVAHGKLACRAHWFMIPRRLRDAVWDAYRFGAGAGSPAHRQAMADAIEALNEKLPEARDAR